MSHPVSYLTVKEGYFRGLKRPERESEHSPPSSATVKNAWRYTSTPCKNNVILFIVSNAVLEFEIQSEHTAGLVLRKCVETGEESSEMRHFYITL
jgi:hypothetical protein